MTNPHCLFCKIVRGEIPAVRLFEDDVTLAFLDIGPIIKGHTLVIPKLHYDPLMTTPDEVLARVMRTVRRIACALVAGLGADGINLHQSNGAAAGQVIPHLHIHVIPRFANDGHHWNWQAKRYTSPAEMEALAARVIPHLKDV